MIQRIPELENASTIIVSYEGCLLYVVPHNHYVLGYVVTRKYVPVRDYDKLDKHYSVLNYGVGAINIYEIDTNHLWDDEYTQNVSFVYGACKRLADSILRVSEESYA